MTSTPARVIGTDGKTEIKIDLSFTYDPDDPFAFRMKYHPTRFNEEVEWVASLDLLREGLTGPAGLADLQVWPEGRKIAIRIASDIGCSVTRVPAQVIKTFLKEIEEEEDVAAVKVEDVVRLSTEQLLEDLGLYPYDTVPDMSRWRGPSLPDDFCHHCLRVHTDEGCED